MLRASAAAAALLTVSAALAQYVDPNIDWKEIGVPDAPAFEVGRLILIEPPRGSSLTFGIDPETISIGSDGVVRYVVVASSSSGATNALFEGIRCSTGEFRVYARHHPGSGWSRAGDSEWKSVFEDLPSQHPHSVARAGVCDGKAPNGPLDTMIRTLRGAPQWRRGPIQ